jgi:DNA-binding NarL/FixJ family response regulator
MNNQPARIGIVIADDHPLYRQGLRQVIEADSRLSLLGEAENGEEALALIERLSPELAVLDLHMPRISGWEIAASIRDRGLRTRLVVLTMLKEEAAFNRAMTLGVQGYLLKESAVTEIANCLITVAAGIPYISPMLADFLFKRRQVAQELIANAPTLEDLTMAERRILKRIADKRSSKEIAIELGISPRTVDTHRANIGSKLGLRGNNSLLQFAIENRDSLAQLE